MRHRGNDADKTITMLVRRGPQPLLPAATRRSASVKLRDYLLGVATTVLAATATGYFAGMFPRDATATGNVGIVVAVSATAVVIFAILAFEERRHAGLATQLDLIIANQAALDERGRQTQEDTNSMWDTVNGHLDHLPDRMREYAATKVTDAFADDAIMEAAMATGTDGPHRGIASVTTLPTTRQHHHN